ncbi:hypothetical protein PUR57_17240 [Streptomyces sp. JV176]|uniref:hypothetical protein n=1 Tax=Streptomyces sp. JV176 TaxID=858630 RepID=UPI002E7969B7|nr:hypothetical protein [Streptomyces sp. JV176]MEE1800391.1 hypothetical protein [Streptomyces sp. JV176]
MTITETSGPTESRRAGPAALLGSVLTGGAIGAAVASVVVGIILGKATLWGAGAGFFLLLVLVSAVSGRRERARTPRAEKRRALAMIESRRATSGEMADVPISFVLTVAPEDRAAYRVAFSQAINLVDIADYPPRRVVVVEYPAHEPWDVTIVTRPDQEWARRAAEASMDSAPESTLVKNPNREGTHCLLSLLALLLGAAVIVLLFRAELFRDGDGDGGKGNGDGGRAGGAEVSVSASASVSSRTTSARTSESMLADGQMRRTVEALATAGVTTAVEFRIEEHSMWANGTGDGSDSDSSGDSGTDAGEPSIELRSLPYERLPALVREARTTSGIGDDGSWRIDIGHDAKTGPLVIRVTVTDPRGSATLRADAQGRVTERATAPR